MHTLRTRSAETHPLRPPQASAILFCVFPSGCLSGTGFLLNRSVGTKAVQLDRTCYRIPGSESQIVRNHPDPEPFACRGCIFSLLEGRLNQHLHPVFIERLHVAGEFRLLGDHIQMRASQRLRQRSCGDGLGELRGDR